MSGRREALARRSHAAAPLAADALAEALATAHDAGAVMVPPYLAMVAALASARPGSMAAAVQWLGAHVHELDAAYQRGRREPLKVAALPPHACFQPELGELERSRDDHSLRDYRVFAELVGKRTFFEVAVYAISGVEVSSSEARMLEAIAVSCMTVDRRAWPMAVTRRIAAGGGEYSDAIAGGMAMMSAFLLAGRAAGLAARFLRGALEAKRQGRSADEVVAEVLAAGERVMGFGRPVVGPDERVPIIQRAVQEAGRAELPYATMLRELEEAFARRKGLRSTAAAWAAAVLSDLGMAPETVEAVSNFWVTVTVHAQAAFTRERVGARRPEASAGAG